MPKRKRNQGGMAFTVKAGTVLENFLYCEKSVSGILGAVGSGKTYTCVAKLLKNACAIPVSVEGGTRIKRYKCAVIRNTYPELNKTTMSSFEKVLGRWGTMTRNPQTGYYFKMQRKIVTEEEPEFLLDATWFFVAMDNEAQVKSLMGLEITDAWINEAREIDQSVYSALTGRLRYPDAEMCGGVEPKHQIIYDSNMPYHDHWTYQLTGLATDERTGAIIPEKPTAKVHVQPPAVYKNEKGVWVINPDAENRENLPKNYYEDQLENNVGDEAYIEANLAQMPRLYLTGKPVFSNYSQTLHYSETLLPNPKVPPIVGVDFGMRNAAAVFLQCYVNGRIIASSELVVSDKTTIELAELILAHLGEFYNGEYRAVIGDPAGDQQAMTDGRTAFGIMRASGLKIKASPSQKVDYRIATVNKGLITLIEGKPRFMVGVQCPMLHKALAGEYRYAPIRTRQGERYHDKPEKNNSSHIADATQYGLSEVMGNDPIRREHPQSTRRPHFWGNGNLW